MRNFTALTAIFLVVFCIIKTPLLFFYLRHDIITLCIECCPRKTRSDCEVITMPNAFFGMRAEAIPLIGT